MTGVTHFERRGQSRKQVPPCRVCGKLIKATPRSLAGEKRQLWLDAWKEHLAIHVGNQANLSDVIETAYIVSAVAEEMR